MRRASDVRSYEQIVIGAPTKAMIDSAINMMFGHCWKVRFKDGNEITTNDLAKIPNHNDIAVKYRYRSGDKTIVLVVYESKLPCSKSKNERREWTARIFTIPEDKLQYANQHKRHFEVIMKGDYTLID